MLLSEWNPAQEDQVILRMVRVGNLNDCIFWRMRCPKSMDERVLWKQNSKRRNAAYFDRTESYTTSDTYYDAFQFLQDVSYCAPGFVAMH